MLYILLIIIAIGVLLASETGQELLRALFILALIAGGAYLAFWIVVFIIGLFSDKDTRESILIILGVIGLFTYTIYWIYVFCRKYQRGELTKQIIRKKLKNLWLKKLNDLKDFWLENWKHRKGFTIFMLTLFSLSLFTIIWSLILN